MKKVHDHVYRWKYCIIIFAVFNLAIANAQVQYDSNGVVIVSASTIDFAQDTFTAPAGTDRLVVAFVSMESFSFNTVTVDSIVFNHQSFLQSTAANESNLYSEIWYLSLGTGSALTDTVKMYFSGDFVDPNVVAGLASFQLVEQTSPIGLNQVSTGSGTSAELQIAMADAGSLIVSNCANDGGPFNPSVITPTGTNQFEIFESANPHDDSGEGSIQPAVHPTNMLGWSFSLSTSYVIAADELRISETDQCPEDPEKLEPGICGCGVEESYEDGDNDGTPDCADSCPEDPDKIEPGFCGCGVPETDTDADGTPDCIDLCPLDSLKIDPGICGCGIPDTDTDMDGTPDCNDPCPLDSLKIAPGICGCGIPDTDSDMDGTEDCLDLCPFDSLKTDPGYCGCGFTEFDGDSDGTPDCVDLCPNDPLKNEPGVCGCDVPDVDSNNDGIADCNERGDLQIYAELSEIMNGPQVIGIQVANGDTTQMWSFGNTTGDDSTLTFMQNKKDKLCFGIEGKILTTIQSTGNVSIGLNHSTTRLAVNGEASKATPGNWLGYSDARLKHRIANIDSKEALDKVLHLHPVSFTWNDTITGIYRPPGIHFGLLAQEMLLLFPDLVSTDTKGYLLTSYGTFDPLMITSIQGLHAESLRVEEDQIRLLNRLDVIERKFKQLQD